jgi:hypothetical protein
MIDKVGNREPYQLALEFNFQALEIVQLIYVQTLRIIEDLLEVR